MKKMMSNIIKKLIESGIKMGKKDGKIITQMTRMLKEDILESCIL
jgi:hypothetical protein